MIVGVCGYAQHGKDSVGHRLADRWGYERRQFSSALKEMALRLSPIVGTASDIENRLGLPPTFPDNIVRLSDLVSAVGPERAKELPEVRRIYQDLGTQCVRDILGDDSWIRALEKAWLEDGAPHIVITDLRFPNEAEWVHRNGGVVVRVKRYVQSYDMGGIPNPGVKVPLFDNGIGADHPSERHVADLPADYSIVNDGDLADLDRKVDAIAADIAEGFVNAAWNTALKDFAPWRSHDGDCDGSQPYTAYELQAGREPRPGDAVPFYCGNCE